MKFEPPRVLECAGSRFTFADDALGGVLTTSDGAMHVTSVLIADLAQSFGWREVTPPPEPVKPFDITKLDTAGVFHAEPEKPKKRSYFFDPRDEDFLAMDAGLMPHCDSWVEVLRPDIANATVAELRARVAELEAHVSELRERSAWRLRCVEYAFGSLRDVMENRQPEKAGAK
jgi:hypothetical protein